MVKNDDQSAKITTTISTTGTWINTTTVPTAVYYILLISTPQMVFRSYSDATQMVPQMHGDAIYGQQNLKFRPAGQKNTE